MSQRLIPPHGLLVWDKIDELTTSPATSGAHREREAVQILLHRQKGWENATLAHTPEGVPYLPDFPSHHISISHTSSYVALLIAPSNYRIGIDIQPLEARIPKVLARIATPREEECYTHLVEQGSPHVASLWAHLVWSAKETAYKQWGTHFARTPMTAWEVVAIQFPPIASSSPTERNAFALPCQDSLSLSASSALSLGKSFTDVSSLSSSALASVLRNSPCTAFEVGASCVYASDASCLGTPCSAYEVGMPCPSISDSSTNGTASASSVVGDTDFLGSEFSRLATPCQAPLKGASSVSGSASSASFLGKSFTDVSSLSSSALASVLRNSPCTAFEVGASCVYASDASCPGTPCSAYEVGMPCPSISDSSTNGTASASSVVGVSARVANLSASLLIPSISSDNTQGLPSLTTSWLEAIAHFAPSASEDLAGWHGTLAVRHPDGGIFAMCFDCGMIPNHVALYSLVS